MKGKLNRWNDERGFGFIRPLDDSRDVFLHLSALRAMSRRPIEGDLITFEIHQDNDGKLRAVNASIDGVAKSPVSGRRIGQRRASTKRRVTFGSLLLTGALLILIAANYTKLFNTAAPGSVRSQEIRSQSSQQRDNRFTCGGKKYCSQMTSCEEAMFYLKHCPGTQMDGDGDGIPCESQWCSW